jgi:DnaJ-class molecular chaperone
MAKIWHPDRFLEPQQKLEAEEKIKQINEAYHRLKTYQPSDNHQVSSVKFDSTSFNAETSIKEVWKKPNVANIKKQLKNLSNSS